MSNTNGVAELLRIIEEYGKYKNMTHRQMASKLGYTEETWSRIRHGKWPVSSSFCHRIIRRLPQFESQAVVALRRMKIRRVTGAKTS